jgi:hypothetical protein
MQDWAYNMKYYYALVQYYLAPAYWARSWRGVVGGFLSALGAGELIINVVSKVAVDFKDLPNNKTAFICMIIISSIIGLVSSLPKRRISCNILDVDIPISVMIGDVLKEQGDYVVACNRTFDTTYSVFVSHKSFQGRVQDKYYPDLGALDGCMDVELKDYEGVKIDDGRRNSKQIQYEPGAVVKTTVHDGRNIYWVALACSSPGGAASCSMNDLRRSLQGLWDYIAEKGNKTTLVMPIIGSGRSGLNESRMAILKEILFSFIAYSRSRKIVEELKICIYPDDMLNHSIDINDINAYLCYNCRENRIPDSFDDGGSSGCD